MIRYLLVILSSLSISLSFAVEEVRLASYLAGEVDEWFVVERIFTTREGQQIALALNHLEEEIHQRGKVAAFALEELILLRRLEHIINMEILDFNAQREVEARIARIEGAAIGVAIGLLGPLIRSPRIKQRNFFSKVGRIFFVSSIGAIGGGMGYAGAMALQVYEDDHFELKELGILDGNDEIE